MGIMDGKVVFLTGATRGIGFATARVMLKEGAEAIAICGRNEANVAAALAKLNEEFPGRNIDGYWPNLLDQDEVEAAVNAFAGKYSRLDAACPIAGITQSTSIKRMGKGEFEEQVSVNLIGSFYVDRAAGLIMRNQKSGSIVNISSMTGLYGSGMGAGYGASKGGVISMTKSLARELGFWGVRVNCVAPGSIKTDMTAGLRDAALKAVNDGIALRRMGEPEEVANVIMFLASDLASYVNGACFSVDGYAT